MLCEDCRKNDATIFLVQIVDGKTTERSLCEQCGSWLTRSGNSPELLQSFFTQQGVSFPSWDGSVAGIIAADPRYPAAAYLFIRDGLHAAIRGSAGPQHVTAAELLQALRSLARQRFGTQAREQLRAWNITSCEDFGEIVFALIDQRVFGKRPEDKKEDFSNGYDFADAFPEHEP